MGSIFGPMGGSTLEIGSIIICTGKECILGGMEGNMKEITIMIKNM